MTLIRALAWSLRLDCEFLFSVKGISLAQRVRFVAGKYLLYLRDTALGGATPHSAMVLGARFCYNEPFGPASLQRVYCASHTLKGMLPEHPTVLDVGANIGQFHLFARHYLGARRIVSVEPIGECHRLLAQNALDPADCLCCAVSDRGGEVDFYLAQESSQLSSYVPDAGALYRGTHRVPAATLDDIAAERQLDRIDLLKIDTEGSEYDVLRSARAVLSRTDLVLVEMSVLRPSAGNLFRIGTLLEEEGFRLVELAGPGGRRPKDMDAIFKRV